MPETQCRHFSGYKPCGKSDVCDALCPARDIPLTRIIIVHLEALGSVLRSTVVLPAVKRKFPSSHITWVTSQGAAGLLQNNPFIDRLLTNESDDLLVLMNLHFDVGLTIDKAAKAAGILKLASVQKIYGFVADGNGAILPATSAALEFWQLGLSDEKKFFENQKTENQLLVEALELGPYVRDECVLKLTEQEVTQSQLRREAWLGASGKTLVGINTGCSGVIPYKKLTVSTQASLIGQLQALPDVNVVLLGGREDTARNRELAWSTSAILSPTENGLRDGLISVNACDVVVSGDSLGMHMAIALRKWVVAWFGPTCAQEVDLFERGQKVLAKAHCAPCYKRTCHNEPMCYDLVPISELVTGVREGISWLNQNKVTPTSSSRRPTSETSSSPSP